MKSDKILKFLELLLGIFTLLILIGEFFIFFNQTKIMDKQTEILDKTTQLNKADLSLISSQGNLAYELSELDEKRESEPLAIGIVNYGKSIAPFVKIKLIPGTFVAVGEYQYGWEIRNLKSLDFNSTFFRISLNSPSEKLLPEVYNLTFSIECPYCDNSYREENITICVRTDYKEMIMECGEQFS